MSNTSKRFTVIFGIILSIAMGASLILPLLTSNIQTQPQAIQPTATPLPTLPPPPDTSAISFDETYLHPSGLFTLGVPSGWQPTVQDNSAGEARVSLFNGEIQSVVETRLLPSNEAITSPEDLNGIFNESWLQNSWRDYQSWEESRRVVEDDRLLIDFNLSRSNQNYIARQMAWTDGDYVYVTRVVALENASGLLQFVLNNLADTLTPVQEYIGTPIEWDGYYDNQDHHAIRFPSTWTVTDAAEGAPATIEGESAILSIEAAEGDIESEDDVRDWVVSWRPDAEILGIETVQKENTNGYAVSYQLTTLDGTTESGLAILLNGSDGQVHVANLRLEGVNADLNSASDEYTNQVEVVQSFQLFPDLNIATPQ